MRPIFKGESAGAAIRSLEGLQRLAGTLGFEVVTPAVQDAPLKTASGDLLPAYAVHDELTARRAADELARSRPDLLIIQHTTFATGELLAPLLGLEVPTLAWALPEGAGGRGDSGPLPLNSLCGVNMTMSLLDTPQIARQLPVKWIHGEVDSPAFTERFEATVAALRVVKAVQSARILHIGGTAPHFYGIEELPALAGVQVERIELEELFGRIEAVAAGDARELVREWLQREDSSVGSEGLQRTAALQLALAELARDGEFDAVAFRCWPELPERCGTMACAAMGNLMGAGVPTACEGDVMGALSLIALQAASGEPPLLMDLSDVDPQRGLLFWHCGNGPLEWARPGRSKLTTHFNRDGVGTVRDMVVAPGPATGFRLLKGGRKALLFTGEYLNGADDAGFDGVRGWLGDLAWDGEAVSPKRFLEGALDARLPHHYAFGKGDLTTTLREASAWLGAGILPLPGQGGL